MIRLLADATLPDLDTLFNHNAFKLETYHHVQELKEKINTQDVLLCRANLYVNHELLENTKIKCIATASSGSCHIDKKRMRAHQISIIDAKGCNASSVCDYVIATLAYLIKTQTLKGRKIGIIGYGEVGKRLYARLCELQFEVCVVDPYEEKRHTNIPFVSLEALNDCDVISIHANYHLDAPHSTHHLINDAVLRRLKPDTIIINAARGQIVDEKALLAIYPPRLYCTDVYHHEPNIDMHIVKNALIATPHIAGHSIDAKRNAVLYAARGIYQWAQLKPPMLSPLENSEIDLVPFKTWEDKILALYNPIEETQQLKQSSSIEKTFLDLRKKHTFRRDFSAYTQFCFKF